VEKLAARDAILLGPGDLADALVRTAVSDEKFSPSEDPDEVSTSADLCGRLR
jgi:hypothetical protein